MSTEFGVHLYSEIDNKYKAKIEPIRNKVPVDIIKMAQSLDIQVNETILSTGISGMIKLLENKRVSILVTVLESDKRRRFTIAHEIAHYLLGHLTEGELTENVLLRSDKLSNMQEIHANYLAAELLMPIKEIDRIIKKLRTEGTLPTIKRLADVFYVSEIAMRIRLGIA